MIKRPYRIGKKVGVFSFNAEKNTDELKEGRIVARKWWRTYVGRDQVGLEAKYVVRYEDGTLEVVKHDELWTRWGHEGDIK